TTKPESAKSYTDGDHIHPLFRRGSISPPPTPGPGTVVTASPVAGQTISVQMLNRVRASTIYANGARHQSPVVERGNSREEFLQDPGPTSMAPPIGNVPTREDRRSGRVHEKKHDLKRHDLNESPHET